MICVKFTLSNMWCTVNQEETEMKNEFQMTILRIKKDQIQIIKIKN